MRRCHGRARKGLVPWSWTCTIPTRGSSNCENVWGPDDDFWVELADELGARTIIDLGCGTGQLTRALAVGDRVVIGVDPSPAMLVVAR